MKVVITRPIEKGSNFGEILKKEGFEPILIPTLDLVFKNINLKIDDYSWIVFTSPRGVEGLLKNLSLEDVKKVTSKKIGVIGIETAKEFKNIFGKDADIIPNLYTAENLLLALKKEVKSHEKVLIPTTPSTRDVLKEGLNAELVFVYSSEEPNDIDKKIDDLKKITANENKSGRKIVLTFTSSLTARNFFKHVDLSFLEVLKKQEVVSIGPITKKTVDSFGFDSKMHPENYTTKGMVFVIKGLSLNI
ncbi:Uroporphyrinogen III synthase HEM4 [Methanococcus vannielii SB]|uniref:Uroporphyrinogen-III synthase n=1 Tax=Methanococcus vannielii (strain ATCC 35089 / DSM 1224 / JCM 13029 / OCM 148 / SB) TaxID=406327 RepID=A6US06_METVS|nr:uroporphyrinogen-III synthase [Methanococcus vannielii]ABR55278.1 Uroporphyrinogen III synthase HEM4 [Methanococcus vannielii SB]